MSNPWKEVNLDIYEKHMSMESVQQLQILNEMMKEQFFTYTVKTIMILGVAGGNGLEHIGSEFDKVYGVDVNKKYLDACENRYPNLEGIFEPICVDLLSEKLQLPCTELIVANLLVEYIGYECFKKVVQITMPKHVSCIIQINTGDSFVSDSPYIHEFDGLDVVHHQMEEKELIRCMQDIGYEKELLLERELPNGKKFVRIDFVK